MIEPFDGSGRIIALFYRMPKAPNGCMTFQPETTMQTLLQIQASLFETAGQSSRLAERFVAGWRATHPNGEVITREVGGDAVPHLTAERFQAFLAKPEARTPEQQAIVA